MRSVTGRIIIGVALVLCALILAQVSCCASTYYVAPNGSDTNNGGQSSPWLTLNKADSAAVAGDQVIVEAGSYNTVNSGTNGVINGSGTAAAPRIFHAQQGVVLVGPSTDWSVAMAVTGNYNIIDGFTITGGQLLTIDLGGKGNVVKNCQFRDETPGLGGEFAYVEGSNNSVHNCIFGPGINDGATGIADGSSGGTTIYNNLIINGSWIAYDRWQNATGITEFKNNIIYGGSIGMRDRSSSGRADHAYNIIYNATTNYDSTVKQGIGEFFSDPQFVDFYGGDYHLQTGSPAIDAGVDVGLAFSGDYPDIGVYETSGGATSAHGTVTGAVVRSDNQAPIAGAQVTTGPNNNAVATTGADGSYTLSAPVGACTVVASASGYIKSSQTTTLVQGTPQTLSFSLDVGPLGNLYYVSPDGNDVVYDGSEAYPFKTITKADSVMAAGDGVIIEPGTYYVNDTTAVNRDIWGNGTADMPRMFIGRPGAVIMGTSVAWSTAMRVLGSYNIIEGLTVNGAELDSISISGDHDIIENCQFANQAPGQSGEVVYLNGTNALIHNCVFGPGINPYTTVFVDESNGGAKIYNNVIIGGNGWAYDRDSGLTGVTEFKNNILYGCAIGLRNRSAAGALDNEYNILFNVGWKYDTNAKQGLGEFFSDPQFVDSAAGNYHLQATSPAIDAGTNVGLYYTGNFPDIGAFESAGSPAPTLGTVTGKVLALATHTGIAGAQVSAGPNNNVVATTASDGSYTLSVPEGVQAIAASATGYTPSWQTITVGDTNTLDFLLDVGPQGNLYYVATTGSDSNNGSISAPWLTFNHASDSMVAGDEVIIKAGTYKSYDSGVNRDIWGSGTSAAPRIFKAQQGAVVQGMESTAFRVIGAYNVIDGFTFTGATSVSISVGNGNSGNGNVIKNCQFCYENSGGGGEVAFIQGANQTFENCIFGPGIDPYYTVFMDASNGGVKLYNNLIIGGNGWAYDRDSGLTGVTQFKNNILYGCAIGLRDRSAAGTLDNTNNILYNVGWKYDTNAKQGAGEIFSDPQFVNFAGGDYHLQATSPAIDAGVNVGLFYYGSAPDIGVYESLPAPFSTSSIGTLAGKSDGTSVSLTGSVVTVDSGVFTGGVIYVEDSTRAAGIRVISSSSLPSVSVGQSVTINGTLTTTAGGERAIEASAISNPTSGSALEPLGVVGKSVNRTTGLLVKVWGRVTRIAGNTNYFLVDDGSGRSDMLGNTGLPVIVSDLVSALSLPADGSYVSVTGLSGVENLGGGSVAVVRPRSADDL